MTDSREDPDTEPATSPATNTEKPGAKDAVWTRQEIESPCVKICMIHPDAKICIGCYRTGVEIAAWSRMSPDERGTIMQDLASRAGTLSKRGGGRSGRMARRKN